MDQTRIVENLEKMADPQFAMCEVVKSLFESINFPSDVDQTRMIEIVSMSEKTVCEANATLIASEMLSKLNLDYLLNAVSYTQCIWY